MDEELLVSGLERIGMPFSADMADALAKYVSEIMLFNPVYKLVGQTDADEIIIAHVLDSAAGCPAFMEMTEPGAVIADLGTGAGLPGIVLSILMPDRHFVLIERMRRRVQFLMGAVARLHLSNAEISEKDIKDEKRAFDAVTARAFHPLYDIIDDVQPILKPDAPAIFYKGQRSNAESELEVLKGEGYSFDAAVRDVRVPYLDKMRTLCVLRNISRQ